MSKNKGFTLVELLVVVAIIAILTTIGMTVFTTAQQNARDGRRRADVDAIAKALETNKTPGSIYYPSTIAPSYFANNTVPVDSTTQKYCIKTNTSEGAITNPDNWTDGAATPAVTACPSLATAPNNNWTSITSGLSIGATVKAWKVCARLESSTADSGAGLSIYCKQGAQY